MITGMNHITLAVKDVNQSFEFYRNILNLTPLVKWNKGAYFLLGDETNDWHTRIDTKKLNHGNWKDVEWFV